MGETEVLTEQVKEALEELLNAANLKAGNIVVIGCSTSEVLGKKIGSASNMDVAKALMDGILPIIKERNLYLSVQCCEHLNRAIVVEEECAEKYNLEIVAVVPQPKAGGSCATTAMQRFEKPVVVDSISAHAGLDIGDTFIGMHMKRVAVPVRLSVKKIGEANLTAVRTRPKLVGGERARYN